MVTISRRRSPARPPRRLTGTRARARWVARRAVRACRREPHWRAAYPSRSFDGLQLELRVPELTDARIWRAARLADQQRFEAGINRSASEWAAAHTDLAWVERCLRVRHAAARGVAWSGLVVTAGSRRELLVSLGVEDVDERTGTGELVGWSARTLPTGVMSWAVGSVALRAFTATRPLRRMVVPVAVGNLPPQRTLRDLGFREELTLTAFRPVRGVPTDHLLYVLHNTSTTRAALCMT